MERRRYCISLRDEGIDSEHVERLFHAFLDLRKPQLTTAVIDAISDDRSLPPEVEEARLQLIELGKKRGGRGDPQMAIHLDLSDPEQYALLRTFGVYSIYSLAYEDGQNVKDQLDTAMSTDDTGDSIDVLVNETELTELARAIGIPFESFKELPAPNLWDRWGCLVVFQLVVAVVVAVVVWAIWQIVLS